MDAEQFTEIRQRIAAESTVTEVAVAQYRDVVSDMAIGRISRMDALNNKSIQEAALRLAEAKLRQQRHLFTTLPGLGLGRCALPRRHCAGRAATATPQPLLRAVRPLSHLS